jgi:hypothetical protein
MARVSTNEGKGGVVAIEPVLWLLRLRGQPSLLSPASVGQWMALERRAHTRFLFW